MSRFGELVVTIIGMLLVSGNVCRSDAHSLPVSGRNAVNRTTHRIPSGFHLNQPLLVVAAPPVRTTSHSIAIAHGQDPSNPTAMRFFSHTNSQIVSQPISLGIDVVPSTPEPPMTSAVPLSYASLDCERLHNMTSERQLQSYIASVEALTNTIQELDEVVQLMKPKACDCAEMNFADIELGTEPAFVMNLTTAAPSTALLTTSESFTDAPVSSSSLRRRHSNQPEHFGMPVVTTAASVAVDQASEDLARAANDLRSLRKDLSVTAEWLKQTNHTVHSAMLRALQAYVTSIERRVDNQRQLYVQTKVSGLKPKIAVIKEKVAVLTEKLKLLAPMRQQSGISRGDTSASLNAGNMSYSAISLPSTTSTTSTTSSTSTTSTTSTASPQESSTSSKMDISGSVASNVPATQQIETTPRPMVSSPGPVTTTTNVAPLPTTMVGSSS